VAVFHRDGSGLKGVMSLIRRKGAKYPVLYDAECRNPKILGISTYPRAFLLDKAGVVVWEGPFWKKNLPRIEAHIRELLANKKPGPKEFRIAYLSRQPGSTRAVVFTMKLDGSNHRRLEGEAMAMNLGTVSPDGKHIVFASDQEIHTTSLDGKERRRLTRNKAFDGSPIWSPDGKQIVFLSSRSGSREIYVMDADGSNPRRLTRSRGTEVGPVWFTR
jgi:hypothetical protein